MKTNALLCVLGLALPGCVWISEDEVDVKYVALTDVDGDGFASVEFEGTDCDDDDADIHPEAGETTYDGIDNDCDETTLDDDLDEDGFILEDDCDDEDAEVNTDATEVCDGIDNDCDDEVDEDDAEDATTWYTDADGDGYGDEDSPVPSCEQPSGTVAAPETETGWDCDDGDETVYPGAVSEGEENNDCMQDLDEDGFGDDDPPSGYTAGTDCDDDDEDVYPGAVAEGADDMLCMQDDDEDGWGDDDPPSGYTAGTDCNDGDPDISPDGTEVCDEIDNDCDDEVDEDESADVLTWYADGDGDGFGDADSSDIDCYQPSGYGTDDTDCDDEDEDVYPGAEEVCDEIDNNCNDEIDEDDAVDVLTWYADTDGDGFGDADSSDIDCYQPSDFVSDDTDCDDTDSDVSPDGTELCDEIDNDCDDEIDEDDAADASTWYADSDGDGYGDPDSTTYACTQPTDYVSDYTDCDDLDGNTHPDALEALGDSWDTDCDGGDDSFSFYGLDVRSGVDVVGPRMIVVPGDVAYLAWMAEECTISGITGHECLHYSTFDYTSYEDFSAGELDHETFSELMDQGTLADRGDFVADADYLGWVRGFRSGTTHTLRMDALNRGTGSMGTHEYSTYGASQDFDDVQAGLSVMGLYYFYGVGCNATDGTWMTYLPLEDLADGTSTWVNETFSGIVMGTDCEFDDYYFYYYLSEYSVSYGKYYYSSSSNSLVPEYAYTGGYFKARELDQTNGRYVYGTTFDSPFSTFTLYYYTHDYYTTEMEMNATTTEVYEEIDVASSDDGVGWFCGVGASGTPWLLSVDPALSLSAEYDLTDTLGVSKVNDCSIKVAEVDMDEISFSGTVSTRQAQMVFVAYRSADDIYYGVVEGY